MSKTTENETVTFEVRTGENGTDRNTWAVVSVFDTGKEAADLVAEMRGTTDKSLVVVRVVTTNAPKADWREREARRMQTGEYTRLNQPISLRLPTKPLPPHERVSYCDDTCCKPSEMEPFRDCHDVQSVFDLLAPDAFAHQSQSHTQRIAYTTSEAMGEADRQTSVKYDVAIERLLGDAPQAIKDAVAMAIAGKGRPLFITTTADEMVEAYMSCHGLYGVESCMSHHLGHYDTNGIHPVSVYADGGDLALAYMTVDGKKDGPITARTLVWPERKLWGRVYTDMPCSEFTNTLRAHGYERGGSNALDGARLARVECGGYIVMPYIDGDQTFSKCPRDPDNYFVIDSNGNYSASRTDGLAAIQIWHCSDCDGEIGDLEEDGYSTNDGYVCYFCYRENYSACHHCTEMRSDVDTEVTVETWRGGTATEYICSDCEANSGSYICIDDTLYHQDLASFCAGCGEGFLNDDLNEDGACDDCAEEYAEPLVQEELARQARIEAAAAAERQRQQGEAQAADMVAEGGPLPAEPMTIREMAIAGMLVWGDGTTATPCGEGYSRDYLALQRGGTYFTTISTDERYWSLGTYTLHSGLMTREAYDEREASLNAIKDIGYVWSNGEPANVIGHRHQDGGSLLLTCSAGWRTLEHPDGAWFVPLTDDLTIMHTSNVPAGLRLMTRADYEATHQADTILAA